MAVNSKLLSATIDSGLGKGTRGGGGEATCLLSRVPGKGGAWSLAGTAPAAPDLHFPHLQAVCRSIPKATSETRHGSGAIL